MKRWLSTLFLLACLTSTAAAQQVEYMQINLIESVVPGGMGRSKMLITGPDGNTTEQDVMNIFSMAGINFGNLSKNETTIVKKLNELGAQGWELESVTGSSYSPGDGNNGIYMTRYTLKRERRQ
jgi:hypothetical protein